MRVNSYSDYMAYTFEENDLIFMLGMKYINISDIDNIVPAIPVKHNNSTRLLYGTENFRFLANEIVNITNSELAIALKKLIDAMFKISSTDYINITSMDICYERLLYDIKNKCIKIILLPINYECDFHDGSSWSSSFRRSMLMILGYIFKDIPDKYQEVYYSIMDEAKSDYDVLLYMKNYEFGIKQVVDISANVTEHNGSEQKMILEHSSSFGNLIFRITKAEFVLGKAENAVDGVIPISSMISRIHCKIYKEADIYMVEDMQSTNGTCINGYALNAGERYYLNNGDRLSLADIDFNVIIE